MRKHFVLYSGGEPVDKHPEIIWQVTQDQLNNFQDIFNCSFYAIDYDHFMFQLVRIQYINSCLSKYMCVCNGGMKVYTKLRTNA